MARRGENARAASGGATGCAPAGRAARGARLRAPSPGILILVLFGVLLSVSSSSPVNSRIDRVHEQSSPWQGQKYPPQMWCSAGFHLSEDGKACIPCTSGQDYTEHKNTVQSCIPCTVCRSDQEELTPCTTTANRKCECKNGTFSGENSPEVCETCTTRCPRGMIVDKPCTSWSDLKCVNRGSGARDRKGVTPAPGEPLTKSGLPPSPSSGNGSPMWLWSVIPVVAILVFCVLAYLKWCKTHGTSVNHKCLNKVFFSHLRWSGKEPGAQDNAHNSIMSNGDSLSTVASEQVLEGQQQAEPPGAAVQTPTEAESLMPSMERSQKKSRRLVPVNVAETITSLRESFDFFSKEVPMTSWNQLMRKVGLTENEILCARAQTNNQGETLHCMLMQWLSKEGREASVNTLLGALEKMNQKCAKEEIEKELVNSRMYTYEDEDSALS